jgi:hypothetical protein
MSRGQLRIEQMYAFVMLDPEDNTEGVPAFTDPATGNVVPLVAADMKRVDSLRAIARLMVKAHPGSKMTLCRFEVRTELETIE